MSTRKMGSVFLVLAVLLLTFTGCRSNAGPSNADKTILYGLENDPKTLDPQIASGSDSLTAIHALFEGLVRLDADGNAVPGVAEKWTGNTEHTEFTFQLRTNAKWSNKDPVTANDFVYAFRRALSPQTNSAVCSQMFCIQNARKVNAGTLPPDQLGVAAKDSHTLVIHLENAYPDFPKLTANAVFMPCNQKFFESTSGRYGLDSSYVLGNGPFRIDGKYGWVHEQYLNTRRSGTYSGNTAPLPSNVNFRIAGEGVNLSDPVAALQNEAVDAVSVSSSQARKASESGCSVFSYQDSTWGLCFNTNSDLMKNAKVRKAFIQAFSRKNVLSHLPQGTTAADEILLPDTTLLGLNYRKLAGGPFLLSQDTNASQTLTAGLQELGLTQVPSISVLCPDNENVKLMLNEMIIAWNSQFQNYFNMETVEESALLSRVNAGSYQIAVYPVRPGSDGPSQVLSLFQSNANGNFVNFKDSNYDSLLSEAENADGTQAAEQYAEAEKYLNQQAVFYPLYYGKRYFATAEGVTGIVFHPYQGSVDFISAGKE